MQPLPAAHSGDASQQSQLLGKGEPPMRSHWTNPTIIRRPTIAALAAAALLVACDQPTDPASRPAGRILADATGGTVSAHGSGTIPGSSGDFGSLTFNTGGLKFSFDFSGANTAGT